MKKPFRQARSHPGHSTAIPCDNETGRKTFFWYRVHCAVMVALNILHIGIGVVFLLFDEPEYNVNNIVENRTYGIAYLVWGAPLALIFAVALFLPKKSYNWVVGKVMIVLGMITCCTASLPASVPLLIFWLKPETKAFFDRK